MIRVAMAVSTVLLVGSIAAFLLFVPILSIATVVCLVAGLMLMFGLGFQMGPQELLPQTVAIGERTKSAAAAEI